MIHLVVTLEHRLNRCQVLPAHRDRYVYRVRWEELELTYRTATLEHMLNQYQGSVVHRLACLQARVGRTDLMYQVVTLEHRLNQGQGST